MMGACLPREKTLVIRVSFEVIIIVVSRKTSEDKGSTIRRREELYHTANVSAGIFYVWR